MGLRNKTRWFLGCVPGCLNPSFVCGRLQYSSNRTHCCLCQVDAMKVGVKQFKQAYKNVNIDKIEVTEGDFWQIWCSFLLCLINCL